MLASEVLFGRLIYTLHSFALIFWQNGTCTCGFTDCPHLMAVRIAAGLPVNNCRKRTNLSALRRKCRGGRRQGRKRALDASETCAPDSVRAKRVEVAILHFTVCSVLKL